jgi:phage terminase large subunit
MTAMGLILDLLKQYGLYKEENHNKTANNYVHGSNIIWFASIDESDKIKSTNFNYIWVEEANEISWEDYIILKLRLRGPVKSGEVNQIILSLNPSDSTGWIPLKLTGSEPKGKTYLGLEPETEVVHSTYTDNPYLDSAYTKLIEDLATQDEGFYRVYALGLWGRLEGKIYSNYEIVPELPKIEGGHWAYGLDFGYSSISTLIKVHTFQDKTYVNEVFYKKNWTNADIIEALGHVPRGDIYGDPSSKQAVKEISQAGYTALEGIKDVKESIDLCKRQKLIIPQASVNLIKEIQNYHWKANPKATGQDDAFLPEPVKYNDHAVDAMRYAVWGVVSRFGFPTQQKRSDGPIESLTFGGKARNKILDRWLKRG